MDLSNKKLVVFGANSDMAKSFLSNDSLNAKEIIAVSRNDLDLNESIKTFRNDNYTNSLYLRFEVKDKQGVLSLITNRLAKFKISVKRIIQTPDKKNKIATN